MKTTDPGTDLVAWHAGKVLRIGLALCDGDVLRRPHERVELSVGDGRGDPIQNPATDTRCTGSASGVPQFSHPIQKSPPGIQTIPVGAEPGAGDVLIDGAGPSDSLSSRCRRVRHRVSVG